LITVNRLDFDDDVSFRQTAGRGLAAFGVRLDFALGVAVPLSEDTNQRWGPISSAIVFDVLISGARGHTLHHLFLTQIAAIAAGAGSSTGLIIAPVIALWRLPVIHGLQPRVNKQAVASVPTGAAGESSPAPVEM
jgi:hypothetical protein